MPESDTPSRKRKRGIKASRAKLEEAMSNAGFRTQASLAEAIADAEKIDTAPKDIVSKIFREMPVSPASIQRLASVLGVQADTLYKPVEVNVSDASKVREETQSENIETTFNLNKRIFLIGFILFLVVITTIIGLLSHNNLLGNNQTLVEADGYFAHKKPALGVFSLIISIDDNTKHLITYPSLRTQLENNFTISEFSNVNDMSMADLTPNEINKELQSDFFLKIESIDEGSFISIKAFLYADDDVFNVWSAAVRKSYIESSPALFLQDLVATIEFEIGIRKSYLSKFNQLSDNSAISSYLKGRNLLDKSQDVENFVKAQFLFEEAISLSPTFSIAYAGLCEALVSQSWTSDEKEFLEKAQPFCDNAFELSPAHPYVVAVRFFLLRRTGRVENALQLDAEIDHSWSKGVDYVHALATTKFDAYRQQPDKKHLIREAKALVKSAISIDPRFWQSYNTLGLIEFSEGNTLAAIDAMAIAVKYNPNELSYVNLGVLSFCQANEADALYYFGESLKLTNDHYLANEMIGLVHYYNQNYQASFDYRKQALDSLKHYGVHNIHGTLAESAEKLKMYEKAKKYYSDAYKIIERDKLRGNLTPTDEAIGLYYQVKLRLLDGEELEFETDALQKRIIELSKFSENLESAAIIKLALVNAYFEEFEIARTLISTASQSCPVYLTLPDFAYIVNTEKST